MQCAQGDSQVNFKLASHNTQEQDPIRIITL